METKKIAGKIIPALATTTSLVSGLVMIELYKLVMIEHYDGDEDILSRFRTGSFNLALQLFGFAEPYQVKSTIINNRRYNIWTDDTVEGESTLEELIEIYDKAILIEKNEEVEMEIGFIAKDQEVLYQSGMPSNLILKKKLKEIIKIDEMLTINLEPSDGREDFADRTDTMISVRIR